jgi:hypothetical protein
MNKERTYEKAIKLCNEEKERLLHLNRMYIAMTRALKREDIQEQISKSKKLVSVNKGFFENLSGSWHILEQSRSQLMDMFFVHSWTLFDSWIDAVLQEWFKVEPERLRSEKKIASKELTSLKTIEEVQDRLIKEEMSSYDWDGPMKKLGKAEEYLGVKAFREQFYEEEKRWLKWSRDIRNTIVHGQSGHGKAMEVSIRIDGKMHHLNVVIRCIHRQVSVIEMFKHELMLREKLRVSEIQKVTDNTEFKKHLR